MNLRLKEFREAKGLTQKQFAKVIGKSVGTIQAWEGEVSFPNANAIWDICVFFDTDPNTLLGWWDEHPRPSAKAHADPQQDELNRLYESCSPQGKGAIIVNARGMAALEKDRGECIPEHGVEGAA